MLTKTPLYLALLLAPLAASAASSTSQDQEYEQVRKIALRDPKVRAAYAEADRKLEAKILQIDPALSTHTRRHSPEPQAQPSAKKPAPKPFTAGPRAFQRSHVVLKGETLTSIATKNGVTVNALKAANHITDERKLAVGQVLGIPAAGTATH